jgi:hypothetical protein
MSEYGSDHGLICSEFLRLSREYLARGNLLQASEKGWGAAAHAAMLIAYLRGWTYIEHGDFAAEVVSRIARETGLNEVHIWARSANELHRNFYRDRLNAHTIANYLDDVTNFVNLIRQLTGLPTVDP